MSRAGRIQPRTQHTIQKQIFHCAYVVLWPSPLTTREKGSGNIVYNELSQRNAIIVYLQFSVLNLKGSLLLAGQNNLFYDHYRSYDSFVASVTHFFEVDLQSSSDLSFEFETTGSFLHSELSSFCLSSVLQSICRLCHTHFSSRSVDLQHWSSTRSSKKTVHTFTKPEYIIIAIWLQMEWSDWSCHILEFRTTHCTRCYQTPFSRVFKGAGPWD